MVKIWFALLFTLLFSISVPAFGNTTVVSGPFKLDAGVNPGEDFFGYVDNAWIADHPIPAEKSTYTTITVTRDSTEEKLKILFEQEADRYAAGEESLIGRFYSSGMNTDAINQQGLTPIAAELDMIERIASHDDLLNVSTNLVEYGIQPFFGYYADQDPTNSTWIIPQVEQGGLGLPERDYYFRNDTESKKIQEAYREHIKNVFLLMNTSEAEAEKNARIVYGLEEEMASSQYTQVENRDPVNTTHIIAWNELNSMYPGIGWEHLASITGSGKADRINLHQLTPVSQLDQMLRTVSLDDWKVFLRYKLADSLSPYLAAPFDDEHFSFYSHILNGVETPEPRWKRVLTTVDAGLPDEAGKLYVTAYFDEKARKRAETLSHSIRKTLRERIGNLTWMDDPTKQAAIGKLDAMVEKIGYPDAWMDYSGLNLTGSYVRNVMESGRYSMIHGPSGLEKVGKPVDRTIWWMSPQTVNAYYSQNLNEIVFPAAILQPPFFDPAANDSVNYGGIGTVIGHEMTHGFDDQGRQFDKDGNLRDWWTANDSARFIRQADLLVDQYNRFEVVPGVFVNGNLTLGENIADFGGLTLAYHAWKQAGQDVFDHPGPGNITPVQQVFLSFARIWAGSSRDEALRAEAYSDPHPWVKFRANGVPFNIPEFYEAFPEIGADDTLYRSIEQRPLIW